MGNDLSSYPDSLRPLLGRGQTSPLAANSRRIHLTSLDGPQSGHFAAEA